MFIAANAFCTPEGTSAGAITGSRRPDATSTTANATNQPIEFRTSPNISAPTGAVNDHRTTPLEGTNPPRLSWSRKGSSSIMAS